MPDPSMDTPADQLVSEAKSRGGVWLNLDGSYIIDRLEDLDPSSLTGPDRLSFVRWRRRHAGGIEVEWDSLPVLAKLNEQGVPVVEVGGAEWAVALRFQKDGTTEDENRQELVQFIRDRERRQRDLHQQERVRHQDGFMSVPSETAQLMSGSSSLGAKAKRTVPDGVRVERVDRGTGLPMAKRVTSQRVTVELDPQTIAAALDRPGRRRRKLKTAALQFPLPHLGRAEGLADELPGLVLKTLQVFDTDCMLTLLAGMHHALRGDGAFPAAPSVIGRERGMIGKSGKLDQARRRVLEGHLDTLTRVQLLVTPYGSSDTEDRIPLLVPAGTRRIRGKGEVQLLGLAPQISHRMRTGRCLLMDRRILAADPQRQEWPLRIYWQVFTQLNLNWVGQRLFEVGQMSMRLLDLLERAGLDWRAVQQDRGTAGLFQRVQQAFNELERWRDGGPLLHAELQLGPTEDLREAVVVVTPPAPMAAQLTGTRTLAVAARDQPKALPAGTAKGRKRKTKRA